MLVLIRFSEMRVFSQIRFFNDFFGKLRRKSVHGRIPWAQNSGNPFTKVTILLFEFRTRFFVFWKSKKHDDFRGPFGVTVLVKTVIFIKFQGRVRVVNTIWSGRFGWAPVVVLVIFNVALWWQYLWLTWEVWIPRIHCGGKGVNN